MLQGPKQAFLSQAWELPAHLTRLSGEQACSSASVSGTTGFLWFCPPAGFPNPKVRDLAALPASCCQYLTADVLLGGSVVAIGRLNVRMLCVLWIQ